VRTIGDDVFETGIGTWRKQRVTLTAVFGMHARRAGGDGNHES
jgi:hypothetical protein